MNGLMRRPMPALLILLFVIAGQVLWGQATTGALLGVVTDPSGNVIGDAEVNATGDDTGLSRTVRTAAEGNFIISNLLPGRYSLSVSKSGFKTLTRSGLMLDVDQKVRLELRLEIGSITEKITVEAQAPALQTQSVETGHVIGSRQILDLPLLGRGFLSLTNLIPGVYPGGGGNQANYSINGQREFGNSIMVNGIEVTGNRNNDSAVSPSLEAVQEFKAVTSTYAPEFGRAAGGVITIQTKSGSNDFHGSAFEFLRTNKTTARSFFSREPSQLKQNNFGVSLGGPIVKNKTFFFAAYEGLRSRDTYSWLGSTVPSGMIRYLPSGDVDLSGLKDPLNGNQIPIFDPDFYAANYYSQPFPGNIIPASRVSPAAVKILQKMFPAPSLPGTGNGWYSNFPVLETYEYNSDTGDVRVDHSFGDKDRVSVSYDISESNSLTGDPYAGLIPIPGGGSADYADTSEGRSQDITVSYSHIFTPSQLNEVRLGYVRGAYYQNDLLHDRNLADEFGIKNVNIPGFPQTAGFPQIQLAFGPVTGGSTYKPLAFLDRNLQLVDNYSWVRGKHSFKFGYEYRHLAAHPDFSLFPTSYQYYAGAYSSLTSDPTYSYADYSAQYATGGNEIADLLLGLPSSVWQGLQLTRAESRSHEHHFYLQDTWQLTRNLVLTYGLRYEYQAPYTEASNHAANFDPATFNMLLAGRGSNLRSLVPPDRNNFGPRVGLAWQMGKKSVLRTGYGVFYSPENDGRSEILTKNYPFFIEQGFTNSVYAPYTYLLDTGFARPTTVPVPQNATSVDMRTIPDASLQSASSVDAHFRTGYSQMFNFTFQQEFTPYFNIEAGYVGSLGRKLPYAVGDINRGGRISPALGSISGQFPVGLSNYHSLQVKADKEFSRGYSLLVAYTYSKSIDNGPAPFNLGRDLPRNNQQPQDPFNLTPERAVSSTDLRHNLVISNIWEVPIARSAKGWKRGVFGGWQLNGISAFRTGLPTNIVRNRDVPGYGGLRPNVLHDPNLPRDQRTLVRYFDKTAFSQAGLEKTSLGNAGRNLVRGPGVINFDTSLFKELRIGERKSLEIRAEAFNLLNTPHFGRPNAEMSGGNFGSITDVEGIPRTMQLALKVKF